ncbi:hypothetical protein CAPTEDRAFT_106750, partial [Capitella teleta]
IPSILIVMLCWLPFWIYLKFVFARIRLGLLTVLTMTNKTSEVASTLPKVSCVKAIDIWMTTCLAFVSSAFIEYAIANVLLNREERILKPEVPKCREVLFKPETQPAVLVV